MKKIRGDESVGIIIHTNMEISQENSPCSYLYLKQAKMSSFFFFSFFSSTKSENRRAGQVPPRGWAGTSGKSRWWGKGVRG
jgi:hypothetical protein